MHKLRKTLFISLEIEKRNPEYQFFIYFCQMLKTRTKAWIYLIILSLIWGSSYILIKIGVVDPLGNQRIPPVQLGALRLSIAFFVLSPFLLSSLKKIKKQHLLFVALSGLFGNGLPAFMYAYAESHLDSTITGMLNSLVPLFTIIISTLLFGFKLHLHHILGIIIGIFGAFLIVYNKIFDVAFKQEDITPLLVVISATLCYATSLNIIKYKLSDLSSIAITSIAFAFVGPICFIGLFFTDFFSRIQTQENIIPGLWAVVLLSIMGTALAVLLFNYMVKISSPIFASSVTYFIPIVVIILGLLYGEDVSFLEIGGIITLIAGVLVINKKTASK